MKTIERLLCLTGGLPALGCRPLTILKAPFLPLRIRHLGIGPRDFAFVSVAQLLPSKSNDQVESELTFDVDFFDDNAWIWYPVGFRQTSPALHHDCALPDGEGGWRIDNQVEAGLQVVANSWEELLVSRGYLDLDILP